MAATVLANGCWTAADNTQAYLASPLDDKDRARLLKEAGPGSGHFRLDYLRACTLLGVAPHPQLAGRGWVVQSQKREEEKVPDVVQQAPRAAPPASLHVPAPAAAGGKGAKPGTAKGSKAPPAEVKQTLPQRAAQELADRVAALTPEDAQPVTEACVRGWVMDVGSAQALQLTVPSCKSLHTLRFWNASLSTRSLTLLADSLKGSSITRMYVDFNPLLASAGDDSGLVFSLLAAPSSPLQLLSLRGNRMGDDACAELMRTLCANKTLLALDLWDNELSDAAAGEAARMLTINTHLQSLNLAKNRITSPGSLALSSAVSPLLITDKEEVKNLKKFGMRTQQLKTRTYREANTTLTRLSLAQNYIGEEGLQGWLDVCAEQVRLAPARGMVLDAQGQEVAAMSLMPAHLQAAPAEKEEPAGLARPPSASPASSAPSSYRKGARASMEKMIPGGGTTGAASSAAAAAGKKSVSDVAAAALAKAEEDVRFPGQQNALHRIDLSGQFCRIKERTWHALRCTPLIAWSGAEDKWTAEGRMDHRAREMAEAAEKEKAEKAERAEKAAAEKMAKKKEAAASSSATEQPAAGSATPATDSKSRRRSLQSSGKVSARSKE